MADLSTDLWIRSAAAINASEQLLRSLREHIRADADVVTRSHAVIRDSRDILARPTPAGVAPAPQTSTDDTHG